MIISMNEANENYQLYLQNLSENKKSFIRVIIKDGFFAPRIRFCGKKGN